jgi:FkbM family methyltransferase
VAKAAAGALPPVAPRAYSTYPLRRLAAEEALQRQNLMMYDNRLQRDFFVKDYHPGDMTYRSGNRVDQSAHLTASPGRWKAAPETLDRILENSDADLDFLKIDVDGADFAVLCGAEQALQLCPVMGVQIEANFQGHGDADANTFSNIDNYLRARGFSLFGMVGPLRYARRDLPLPFLNDFPSESQHGQVIWADALYLRDLAHPRYFEHFAVQVDLPKLAKLIAIAHLFDVDDFAMELVNSYAKALSKRLDLGALRHALTQRHYPGRVIDDVLEEFYGG